MAYYDDDMSIGERACSFGGDIDKLTAYYNGQIDEYGLPYSSDEDDGHHNRDHNNRRQYESSDSDDEEPYSHRNQNNKPKPYVRHDNQSYRMQPYKRNDQKNRSQSKPEEHGWVHQGRNENSRVDFYQRGSEKMDHYYTTGTVKTSLNHPVQGKTQMFRRNLTADQFESVCKNPRHHTNKGYQRKNKK
ncbi:hypothetical protein AKO1_014186 [Acrasis kona]|uniref:Uncharacterized protein n=1 Tax=Acrasis kona TaxID=1008807 RepID=A0AAW2YZF5_9EUKA